MLRVVETENKKDSSSFRPKNLKLETELKEEEIDERMAMTMGSCIDNGNVRIKLENVNYVI